MDPSLAYLRRPGRRTPFSTCLRLCGHNQLREPCASVDFTLMVSKIRIRSADVVELVDTLDLGSSAARRGSSSLPIRTILSLGYLILLLFISLPA